MKHEHGKNITVGKAAILWSSIENKWRLPCGKFTGYKDKAVNTAKRMNRIITGKAKNNGGV